MAENNETNGSTPKAPTMLAKIHQEWVAKGGKRPDAKALEALKKELAAVTDEFQEASRALEAAREKRAIVSLKVMKQCGTKGTIKLADGRLLEASARGEQVFYRSTSGETF